MKKHAYCIIAHSDPYLLSALLAMLDDVRNDIFLLFDKKSVCLENFKTYKSNLYIIPHDKRINIQWGDISQIKAELLLFRTVIDQRRYEYIHLISGSDLCLKNQDYIHNFFDQFPTKLNFIGFANNDSSRKDILKKTNYYYPWTSKYKIPNIFKKGIYNSLRKFIVFLQKLVGIKRKWPFELYKGSNWVSITYDFAKFLIENEKWILSTFIGIPCADEIYKQTLIMNSEYKNTIYDANLDNAGETRKIDWERGKPYVWRSINFDELISSNHLFARKFSSMIDQEIIAKMIDYINKN